MVRTLQPISCRGSPVSGMTMAKARSTRKPRRSAPASRTKGGRPPARSRSRRADQGAPDQSGWPYSQFAVWSRRWGDPNNNNQNYPTTVLLRHPTTPFVGTANVASLERGLQRVAYSYLVTASSNRLINPPLELPGEWLDALDPDDGGPDPRLFPSFGWLRLGWPATDDSARSLVSFRALRKRVAVDRSQDPEVPHDETVILLASQKMGIAGEDRALGSEFGIRVVAHVKRSNESQFDVSISGMSASLPFGVFRPTLLPEHLARTRRTRGAASTNSPRTFIEYLTSSKHGFKNSIAQTYGLEADSVTIQGVRLSPISASPQGFQAHAEVTVSGRFKKPGAGVRGPFDLKPHHSFIFATQLSTSDMNEIKSGPLTLVRKVELLAEARAFPIDPASEEDATHPLHHRRPTRGEDVLDKFRLPELTPTDLDYTPTNYNYDVEKVVVCPGFVSDDDGQTAGTTKTVPPGNAPVRSNNASAIMAYWNVKQFFDRMIVYGIDPGQYFRVASLPLEIHYRSGIHLVGGKDGQTVNAQVRVKGFPDNFEGPIPRGDKPIIEVHLALADLSTRARKPYDGTKPSPAEPLGIAADARWIWHELGHVLLTASIGELQFRFAHSPGDALAAIVSDPESKLATDPSWRGSTFPWVFLPRRHDRCVCVGWSWGGTLHHSLSQVPTSVGPRRKAYWSEQILSSSLFRLYRSIGGDTTESTFGDPDIHARRSASHYCVQLIMRGIQILGSSGVVPANDPDQLVGAMIYIDCHTSAWHVVFPQPIGPAHTFHRVGGCVHKVIRWAFEAQGLYNPFGKITNAPGAPLPVDVYIEDLRPAWEATTNGGVEYDKGSYNPVSLAWDQNQLPSNKNPLAPRPEWQASLDAISIAPNGKISIIVGNRGPNQAQNVTVRLWWHAWTSGPPPQWDRATWTQCSPAASSAKNIPKNSNNVSFGAFDAVPLPPNTRYLLLAQATCADDRANIDPAAGLSCNQQAPLVDLVAGDNNLGLWVLAN